MQSPSAPTTDSPAADEYPIAPATPSAPAGPPFLEYASKRIRISHRSPLLRRSQWGFRVLFWILILDIAAVALIYGLAYRAALWDQSTQLRFNFDIANGFRRGMQVLGESIPAQQRRGIEPQQDPVTDWRAFFLGYLDTYDHVVEDHSGGDYGLDYAPGRLMVMSLWVRHVRFEHPEIGGWSLGYQDIALPLLKFNLGIEIAAAVAAFLLVWYWVQRSQKPPKNALPLQPRQPNPYAPATCGLIAALLVWFDPSVLVEAHIWPQWDVWNVPFFLLAAFLVSTDWCFSAGIMIALGAMLKGQLLFAAPILFLWPLFEGRYWGALRGVIGCAFGCAATMSPWLLRDATAQRWVIDVGIAAACILPIVLFRKNQWATVTAGAVGIVLAIFARGRISGDHASKARWIAIVLCGVAVALPFAWRYFTGDREIPNWIGRVVLAIPLLQAAAVLCAAPWFGPKEMQATEYRWAAALLVAAVIALPWIIRRRHIPFVAVAMLTLATFVAANLYGGSFSWLKIGFGYGTVHFPNMHRGPVGNLAELTENLWRWDLDTVVMTVPAPIYHWISKFGLMTTDQLEFKPLAAAILGLCLLLCSAGAAAHARRNDPRVLISLAAPWVIFYAVLPQMHERYLLWGSAITAIGIGAGLGMAFMHFVVAAISFIMIYQILLGQNGGSSPDLRDLMGAVHPGIAWLTLTCAAVHLYMGIVPRRRRTQAMLSA